METGRYVQEGGEATIPRGHLAWKKKTLIKQHFSMTLLDDHGGLRRVVFLQGGVS